MLSLATAVLDETSRLGLRHQPVLVIGCGVGRIAEELAATGVNVTAVDLSATLLAARALMGQGTLEACDVQTRNAQSVTAQVHEVSARSRTLCGADVQVRYAVADATAMPFADRSWPVVVSVYFTDVVPPSRLFPEAWRVLAPGGAFIHVGPLGYHFDDLSEHVCASELLEQLGEHGFEVSGTRFMSGTHHRIPGSLHTSVFDNLVFSARRPGATAAFYTPPPRAPFTLSRAV